jgi:hypothetical protein
LRLRDHVCETAAKPAGLKTIATASVVASAKKAKVMVPGSEKNTRQSSARTFAENLGSAEYRKFGGHGIEFTIGRNEPVNCSWAAG